MKKKILGLIGIVVVLALFSVAGSAAVGDLLRVFTVPVPGGTATSVGFDGANLYYTNWADTNLYKIDTNGALLVTIPMTSGGSPLSFITALSWDPTRLKFWATAGGTVYLLDKDTGVAVFQFNSGAFDGLAYDASDDTLWWSYDANPVVHHVTTAGAEIPPSPYNAVSGTDGHLIPNSGLAVGLPVGGVSYIYLGSNGEGNIYKFNKATFTDIPPVFAGIGGRDEDLECDSASFPGKNALWSKDAYDGKLYAYEVELGTCVSPPPPPEKGSISGMKFDDLNNNGANDGEPGLSGWTITLTNSSGTVSTVTDAGGNYVFAGLEAGTYTVGEVTQAGWTQTAPQPVPPGTYAVTLAANEHVTGKDFGNFREQPPVELKASCVETVNPAGKNIPTAGANPESGQNPDGFYMIGASDPAADVYVKDMGSGTVFGPFPSGTNIKYTEANGAEPVSKTIGGPNSAVDWHIKGKGDAAVYAMLGNVMSPEVSCLVPPPPK